MAGQKDETTSISVTDAGEWDEQGRSGEVEDGSRPGPCRVGYVEGLCERRQGDVEATDGVLAHDEGSDDGKDEAHLDEPG